MFPDLPLIHWCVLALFLLVASALDFGWRRVPNWLTVGLLCYGLAARALAGGLPSAGWGLLGALVGLGMLLLPFARGWIGGGDVKLLAACGGWLGPLHTLWAALAASLAGGGIAAVYLLRSPAAIRRSVLNNLLTTLLLRRAPEAEPRPEKHAPPYAPAIALGTLVIVFVEARILALLQS
jgi:prepilin peptidase CpaA